MPRKRVGNAMTAFAAKSFTPKWKEQDKFYRSSNMAGKWGGRKKNKFGARKTLYNGYYFDSALEANTAADLDLQKKAGEIKDYELQYKIEVIPYDSFGQPHPELKISHKVDFRVHRLDGTYTLVESKGFEGDDWKRRRKWLESIWLLEHPDHNYVVVKTRNGSGTTPHWPKSYFDYGKTE